MSWNYRIFKKKYSNKEIVYGLKEAYYSEGDKTNIPNGWTKEFLDLFTSSAYYGEDISEEKVKEDLLNQLELIRKDIINYPILDEDKLNNKLEEDN